MYNRARTPQLAGCLDSIVQHVEHMQQLDLSQEADLDQALTESREVLGALVMYRELLQRLDNDVEDVEDEWLLQAA